MWLLEVCVNPQTAISNAWRHELVPVAVQFLLANRPSFLIVRNSWNPIPFEHFPSKPATCTITTRHDDMFCWTDMKVWSGQEIRATCEDCDFISGNMWFYIPQGAPRGPDELFANVVDPLLAWSRRPSGVGEAIGAAEDCLGLLYWNAPARCVDVAAQELRRLARRIGITIENEDAMVIDCLVEEFGGGYPDDEEDVEEEGRVGVEEEDAPRRIPLRDWFWVGIALIILQLFYLASKFELFHNMWA
ncbi:unnamed protein product [Caenorhabditis sp. 36 PRJEB53466]|nr:unnamed protein product [Caenorhabditis sp. 36 PRJEB53466]